MTQYDDTDDKPAHKPKLPDDFANEAEFLADLRKKYADDIAFDQLNRLAATEDLEFFVSDQWDEATRKRREAARKPCLTINRLTAFVAQIVGDRRMNETVIKVLPDNGGTESVARVREGLMRSIQKIGRADIAYDKALESQVICGIGNFQVYLDYENDDVFEQKICIAQIPNPLAVVWDRMIVDGTGADAGHVFVEDTIPRTLFEKRYPDAAPADMALDSTQLSHMSGWTENEDVRIVDYWRMRTHKRTLALMQDGSTRDITDDDTPETLGQVVQRKDGSPIMREVDRKYAEKYVCSGLDVLEGPYILDISRVPVFRVPGWEISIGATRHRWGLVRFLKDPQRLHNYMRSAAAERLMAAPRAIWMASAEAVAGREKDFRASALSDDPLLVYNGEAAQPPQRVPPAPLEAGMIEFAEMSSQDIKDVSNIHEANLGMPSNEVSGAAIQARQRVSDTGTVLYHDNLNQAIEQAGMVINDLIPVVYDTPRVIKVLGEDAKQDLQVINAMDNAKSVDITAGKYSVSVVTGPSFQTKRIESQQGMIAFINAVPQVAGYTVDLFAKAMDWPMHEEFARRAQLTLPPGMINPKDMTPELAQHVQGQAQAAQQQQAMAAAAAQAKIQADTATAAVNFARAKNFQAEADAVPVKLQNAQTQTASQATDRELRGHLEAIKVATGD